MLFNAITWNINPEIFSLGLLSVRYYGLFFALAFIIGYKVMQYVYKKANLPDTELDRLSIYMIIAVIVGARLGHILFYEPGSYLENPVEILKIWEGGLASHGAAIAILIAMFIYSRKKVVYKAPSGEEKTRPVVPSYMWILDRIILTVPIGGFFVRMGNLTNSEIYGHATNLPWGFYFVRDLDGGTLTSTGCEGEIMRHSKGFRFGYEFEGNLWFCPRHPTQIYEGLAYLLIFFFLFSLYRRRRESLKPGYLFGLFLILLFGVRFLVEFFKEVQVAWELDVVAQYGLNQGQLLSIPFILLGIFIMIRANRTVPGEKI